MTGAMDMSETGPTIRWDPLVRRDFQTFRKIALETDDPNLRETALLKSGGLIDALMGEIIRIGYYNDPDSISIASDKYRKSISEGLELEIRQRLFKEIKDFTEYFEDCASTTFLPFLLEEPERGLASTASLDFVSVGKIEEGADEMLLPKFVVGMIERNTAKNRGAVFGGLLGTGDPRVCSLLWGIRHILEEDEINEVCRCHTGFISAATVDFYLRWLEEIVHSGSESLFGKLASGLALIRRNPQTEYVFTGLRPFPYSSVDGDELRDMLKPVPIDEYTREIAPRMIRLTDEEPEPKVMPEVLRIWGICNLPDAKGILISDDLTERCWEVLTDSNLASEEWYSALVRLVDVGIAMGGNLINKVATAITRRGNSTFWELVFDRYEIFLEYKQHDTPEGGVYGQIVAMPLVCPTAIPDEELPEIFTDLPNLPSGEQFKFVPAALRWGELLGNEPVNRLLHNILYAWKAGDAPIQAAQDVASLPSLNETKSALDEIAFSDNLSLKLRFLVGYRLANDPKDEVTPDDMNSWVVSAQEKINKTSEQGNVLVRFPAGLRSALYSGQSAMMSYALFSILNATEDRHSAKEDGKFGVRIECFGDAYAQLARSFTISTYEIETNDLIIQRDIPIGLPSSTARWQLELDELRIQAERVGCPYVIIAPILQPMQLHPLFFDQTKCIKITLGAPVRTDGEYSDYLSLDPRSPLPEDKRRWELELSTLPSSVDAFHSSIANGFGIEASQIAANGTYSLEEDKWLPTVVLFFDSVKLSSGENLQWPLDEALIEAAIDQATSAAGRRWARYSVGGTAKLQESPQRSVDEILAAARNGDLEAQLQMAEMLYYGDRVPADAKTAMQWYRQAALKGDAGAQAMVAYMLHEGVGCERSEAEAFNWFRLGAENGDAYCQFMFGSALEEGLHTPKNVSAALNWYRKAADQGHNEAQFALGWELYSGENIAEDIAAAADLFQRAAQQGNPAAQYNLGVMLAYGEHTEVDHVAAYAWLRLAAEQEYEGAESGLAQLSAKMTANQIEEAKFVAKKLNQSIRQ